MSACVERKRENRRKGLLFSCCLVVVFPRCSEQQVEIIFLLLLLSPFFLPSVTLIGCVCLCVHTHHCVHWGNRKSKRATLIMYVRRAGSAALEMQRDEPGSKTGNKNNTQILSPSHLTKIRYQRIMRMMKASRTLASSLFRKEKLDLNDEGTKPVSMFSMTFIMLISHAPICPEYHNRYLDKKKKTC